MKTHLHEKEEINIITEIQRLARVHFQYDMGVNRNFRLRKKHFLLEGVLLCAFYYIMYNGFDTKYKIHLFVVRRVCIYVEHISKTRNVLG